VCEDKQIAKFYSDVFNEAWTDHTDASAFRNSVFAEKTYSSSAPSIPPMNFTFSPHQPPNAEQILGDLTNRITAEGAKPTGGSVFFAVMELGNGTSPVYDCLNNIHQNASIFSYGISDNPKGVYLYQPGTKNGILVSGKPISTVLPPPFNQVPGIGFRHQIHHKFVVCGFNQPGAVVYCGSSNLALGGEEENGDNLIEIRDMDVATAFAIEALGLVDHFTFLDRMATGGKSSPAAQPESPAPEQPPAALIPAAVATGWFLSTDDRWTRPYFDSNDLKCIDRELFGG
jgi:hypothetical protein